LTAGGRWTAFPPLAKYLPGTGGGRGGGHKKRRGKKNGGGGWFCPQNEGLVGGPAVSQLFHTARWGEKRVPGGTKMFRD